ncbi:hypothetical protein CANCADRAFT_3712 [Tortispora caseinolytica NRRL Y-17796]|uniref:Coatomer subunit zeta n=1 Tax=Tortispora caseinolytica NRRL Y-17796 TaxID=767744 RepID=A0A1E4TBE2_9ASCO|nr:hypothetical protein CANCADRAFT_3712 [Tortispora caseinolytica NRRL Y-17796]
MTNFSLYSVLACIVLDSSGKRIFAKYYDHPHQPGQNPYSSETKQVEFETGLAKKTHKDPTEVILYDGNLATFKECGDAVIYLIGPADENELLLHSLVTSIREALEMILGSSINKRTLLENYDILALTIDEFIDAGVVMQPDSTIVAGRVSRAPSQEASRQIDLSEQGILNYMSIARERISETLRQSL